MMIWPVFCLRGSAFSNYETSLKSMQSPEIAVSNDDEAFLHHQLGNTGAYGALVRNNER